MRLHLRVICCLLSTGFVTLLLLSSNDYPLYFSSPAPPCAHSKPANQSLHQLINELPLDRLTLHTPASSTSRPGLLLVVISAIHESAERKEIRATWASNESLMKRKGIARVIFLVGQGDSIEEEAKRHGDILQVDVEESYRNLVFKMEAGFRWVRDRLPADYVAKIDSDTIVHIDRLHEQLEMIKREKGSHWLGCVYYPHSIERNECSPWFVSPSDYPQDSFPTYCNGPGYMMDWDTFQSIVDGMKSHKVVEVEDAFFTGVVAKGRARLLCLDDVVLPQYSSYADCDSSGVRRVSVLPTHYQYDAVDKNRKNITAAWLHLKDIQCDSRFAQIYRYFTRPRCS